MANSADPDQLASWLLKKPTDLELYCLQKQGIVGQGLRNVQQRLHLSPMDYLNGGSEFLRGCGCQFDQFTILSYPMCSDRLA